ncbi:lysoplasmalogenase TMEM86A isoform X2 [Plodia interpunctella]|uniref:lysoplasmalogenase TMEM86A isoform X2 n=1 Tax=Plodia interpunctella TaxID=58824 RepID=UPI002368C7EA|nr:lysoplasmalogenase-like protein TMEM86A isoform X2 [Plodia interpunctella]
MVSLTDLMKRLGVGGRLVPFFKCVCVYFAAGGGAPSAAAVAAKCAPVLCLLLLLVLQHAGAANTRGRYARLICCGLALSALGDALLVWPQHFVAGMAAFGAAHASYIAAFGVRCDARGAALVLYAATLAFLTLLKPPGALAVLVPLYGILLATMAWRGVARLRRRGARAPDAAAAAAAAGALLFLLSDAILGYSLFGGPLPHKQVLVMSTYYLGQLGIALSALETSPQTP